MEAVEVVNELSKLVEAGDMDRFAYVLDDLPGYNITKYDAGSITLMIPSGYTIRVKRLGPYAFDPLYDRKDLHDPGPMKITVKLMEKIKPPGVEQIIIYAPPDEIPDLEEHPQAWLYYQQWMLHEQNRREIGLNFMRARMEFLLALAVDVLDGPNVVEDDAWFRPLSTLIEPPEDYGNRYMLFLKTQVIRSNLTAELIREFSVIKEVTMEGIKNALRKIRSVMEREGIS